jgi:hypothetical protein
LKKEIETLTEQNKGLVKRIAELEASKPKSKSRQQAEEGLKMLAQGPVALAQFATLNPKYPGDVCYFIRTVLKQPVHTVRTKSGSVYMLPEHFAIYQAGQDKQKAQEKAAAAEAKEEIQTPKASSGPQARAAA